MKVLISIVLSCVIGYLVYSFYRYIISGLSPFLYIVFLVIILIVTMADIFLILNQKVKRKKVIMVTILTLSILSAIVASHIYVPKGDNNGVSGQSSEP